MCTTLSPSHLRGGATREKHKSNISIVSLIIIIITNFTNIILPIYNTYITNLPDMNKLLAVLSMHYFALGDLQKIEEWISFFHHLS